MQGVSLRPPPSPSSPHPSCFQPVPFLQLSPQPGVMKSFLHRHIPDVLVSRNGSVLPHPLDVLRNSCAIHVLAFSLTEIRYSSCACHDPIPVANKCRPIQRIQSQRMHDDICSVAAFQKLIPPWSSSCVGESNALVYISKSHPSAADPLGVLSFSGHRDECVPTLRALGRRGEEDLRGDEGR